jgi:hypothetical protein
MARKLRRHEPKRMVLSCGCSNQGGAHDFYKKWVNDPDGTREMVENLTRKTAGTEECPIPDVPNPRATM